MTAIVFVVDGPRSAGKTTAINEILTKCLELEIDASLHKTPRPTPDKLWTGIHETLTNWYMTPNGKVVLVDRFHLTEYVYSTALGRVDDFELEQKIRRVDERLASFGSEHLRYTVLMASNLQLIHRTMDREEQEKRTFDIEPKLVWPIWSLAIAKSGVASIRMNETPEQANKFVDDAVNWIVTRKGIANAK